MPVSVASTGFPPVDPTNNCPSVGCAVACIAPVPFPSNIPPLVKLPVPVPPLEPQTDEEKARFDAALRRKQLSLVLAGKMNPHDATELKALFQ